MAKQNIKLTKSKLQAHATIMSGLEKTADDQYNAIKSTLNSIKGCFDSQLASAIDRNVNEYLKIYGKVSEHMHVGAWCISLVLKNSEITDADCAAQIEKLIADPPPEKTIARCLNSGYTKNMDYYNYRTRDGSCVWVWNRVGEEVSCTYHTLKRLHDKGLDFPFANSGLSHGGGAWHQNCDTNLAEVRYGTNSIEQLIEEYGCPLENIVVDFRGIDSHGKEYGHVMLIDRIDKEGDTIIVDFSEMASKTKKDVFQTDPNSKGFEYHGWSLEEFKLKYTETMLAAILIGKAPEG